MAHKRFFIYPALLAICYLLGVTWAENATQTLPSSSSNNNTNQVNPAVTPEKASTAAAAPTIATSKVASSTAASGNSSGSAECACAGALLPQVDANGKKLPICAECKCAHVARNTTLIKVVVIIVIWIISILVIYMLFLMCLEPLLNKRVKASNYQEHTNEDDEPTPPMPVGSSNNQELSARANVLNRVGHQQDKWKRQVREQRRHIYDRHTMLN
ncbi:uncharacterized protein CG1161 [Drosophila innubila]|uniref:uncharacterized protein CG1161 n=1 Tax=Drosophila innubila TaxID=198719 RepID=UPI00148B8EF8|nr:uncharacterized protein CG1161 [Drosophila innubila]